MRINKRAVALAFGAALLSSLGNASERLVTLGGDVTEIVFALGAGDRVVAVDSSSVSPPKVRQLLQLGYLRALSAEGVLSVSADRIIANADIGPPAVKQQILAAGQQLELVEATPTPEQLYDKIRRLASLLGTVAAGDDIIAALKADFAALAERRQRLSHRPGVLFVMNHGGGAPMIAGRNTAADSMIQLMGGRNVADAIRAYKPMTAEALVNAAPDWIVVTDQGLEQFGGVDGLLRQPGMALTPAAESRRILSMDALLLLGFGPRTADAATTLFNALHGESENDAQRDY
ncbi:ABC transporter substrate-binding protein [Spongiibacter sp.]|uniref:heme/hemin ABC transporter substrate-binding protein n=1 Tax=Spongiibacter sp. TaxID=2024860 RepID=UPI00257CB8C4|nr:ABC transporter substrate-binding protein [Spongiibacter sp.]